jgi:ubiquinone/menaquinone biosynthesis C-methylase UbiE
MNLIKLFKRYLIFLLKKKIIIDHHKFKKNTTLDFLCSFYGTDKANKYNNGLGHGYTKYYIKHLDRLKNKKIKFLEIGSGDGISAAAFTKYFKKSTAYCLDINLSYVKIKSKKIKFFGLNSSNFEQMNNFLIKNNLKKNSFDFIIDDGSHNLSDQLFSLNYFLPYLKKNSFYIIEDYKFPNYFKRHNDIDELKISEILTKIKSKKFFKSNIIEKFTMKELILSKIYQYKGNRNYSDIVFIKKK